LKGQTWKEESGIGQGVVYDLGSHLIDQVLDLFGMPETITAHIHNSRRVGPADFDDAFTARLYYPSRPIPLTVNLSAGVFSLLDPEPRYVVKGTKASWVKFGVDPQEDQLRAVPPVTLASPDFALESEIIQGTLSTLDESGKIVTRRIPSERGNYQAWFQSVGEAIQSRDPTKLIVKPEQARDVIRVIELMYQSSKEGRTIQVTK
jgi:predicted dehydrogenase